ncbi:MAG: HAD-IA family hydrolase [Candidatus Saccharimonadales bacterium]
MIKAIIFDCFGVLLQRQGHESYKSGHDRAVQQQIDDLEREADLGAINEEEFNTKVAKLTGSTPGRISDETTLYHRNQELLDYVAELRSEYKVSVLTNVSKDAIGRFFDADEQKRMFDDIVISSEVGLVKPDPEIFALAARRLALRPEECIFIDDTAINCLAAAQSGIKAIAYLGNKHTIKMVRTFLAYENN